MPARTWIKGEKINDILHGINPFPQTQKLNEGIDHDENYLRKGRCWDDLTWNRLLILAD